MDLKEFLWLYIHMIFTGCLQIRFFDYLSSINQIFTNHESICAWGWVAYSTCIALPHCFEAVEHNNINFLFEL